MRDKASISLRDLFINGLLTFVICKNITNITNSNNAYTTKPNLFIIFATNIHMIFLYIITISQKKLSFLYPLYKNPNFCYTANVVNLSFSLFIKNQTAAGMPKPQSTRQGRATPTENIIWYPSKQNTYKSSIKRRSPSKYSQSNIFRRT